MSKTSVLFNDMFTRSISIPVLLFLHLYSKYVPTKGTNILCSYLVSTFSFLTVTFLTVFLSASPPLCCLTTSLTSHCPDSVSLFMLLCPEVDAGTRPPVTSLFVCTPSFCIRLVANQWASFSGLTWRTAWWLREEDGFHPTSLTRSRSECRSETRDVTVNRWNVRAH